MESITSFLSAIGQEVEDADEESFILFSQDIPSSNLGFVDSKATSVDISIRDQEYTIHQSPTLLSSSRAGGTTGAVLWKITPLFAEWLSDQPSNPLWTHSILRPSSAVVELGCGISALTALALSPLLEPQGNGNGDGHYIATDQEYVHRLFRQNLLSNPPRSSASTKKAKAQPKGKRGQKPTSAAAAAANTNTNTNTNTPGDEGQNTNPHANITFTSLDWETDHPETLKQQIQHQSTASQDNGGDEEEESDNGFDLLLSCDCIYNEALISPFVRACAEIARLRPIFDSNSEGLPITYGRRRNPTICIIAQQQRSPDVFEAWLRETMRHFRVWRVADDVLGQRLGVGNGYLVHVLVLKA